MHLPLKITVRLDRDILPTARELAEAGGDGGGPPGGRPLPRGEAGRAARRPRPAGDEVVTLWRCVWPKTGKFRKDWPLRWRAAGEKANWKGVKDKEKFKARADSPIWEIMASLYPDGTNSKTPPFAINSGMGWRDSQGRKYHPMIEDDEKDGEEPEERENAEEIFLLAAR